MNFFVNTYVIVENPKQIAKNPKHIALHYLKISFIHYVMCNILPLFAGIHASNM
jgi:hypothetical protein